MKRQRKFENQKVEECGIWLDTEELKRKRPKARSISEFLSPLCRSKYNIEVALNFTQTRAPQRCVKQTTVSSFFFPKSKGNPRSPPHTSSLQALDTASPFSCTTEEEALADQPELIVDADSCGDDLGCKTPEDGRETLPITLRGVYRGTVGNNSPPSTAQNTTPAPNEQASWALEHSWCKAAAGIESVISGLQSCTTAASIEGLILPPNDSAQLDFTQDSQGTRVISHRGSAWYSATNHAPDQRTWSRADLETPCTESFRADLLGSLTSTQRTTGRALGLSEGKAVLSPKKLNPDQGKDSFLDDKENTFKPVLSCFLGKRKNLKQSPLKRPLLPLGNISLPQYLSVPRDEPLAFKRWQGLPSELCELSVLFSQDSQGNRVISHWSTDSRSRVAHSQGHRVNTITGGNGPPHGHLSRSDLALCKSPSALQPEDNTTFSPLFTQDSEGHAVIKHSSRAMH